MSSPLVGFLIGIAVAAWVYSKMMRRTGGNIQNSIIIAGIVGFFAFILGVTAMSVVNSSLS